MKSSEAWTRTRYPFSKVFEGDYAMSDHTPQLIQSELPYPKLCKCGCGQFVPVPICPSWQQKYISGHHPAAKRPLAERFWEKVDVRGPDECWEWQGALDRRGYGQIKLRSYKRGSAHRVAYELHYGPIPDGVNVLHKCDNPPCCNWSHLFAGSTADNVSDKIKKGRQPRGEDCWQAILTESDVLEIRRLYREGMIQRAIAIQYGTSYKNVFNIVHYNSWKHLP